MASLKGTLNAQKVQAVLEETLRGAATKLFRRFPQLEEMVINKLVEWEVLVTIKDGGKFNLSLRGSPTQIGNILAEALRFCDEVSVTEESLPLRKLPKAERDQLLAQSVKDLGLSDNITKKLIRGLNVTTIGQLVTYSAGEIFEKTAENRYRGLGLNTSSIRQIETKLALRGLSLKES